MSFRGLFRRAVQSLRLARMGLAISRAEVKRAAAASAPPSVRRAGSAPQPAQQLTPAQLQERIRELRQSLVRSEAEHQHEERAVQSSQHHHQQQQGGAPPEKSAAEAAALDRQAEEQLAAFNARLDALAAEKEEAYLKELQRNTRDAVLSHDTSFGALGGTHGSGNGAEATEQGASPAAASAHDQQRS